MPSPPVAIVRIRRRSGWQPIDLGELWRHHELFWILAMRDIKVRYKQTAYYFKKMERTFADLI